MNKLNRITAEALSVLKCVLEDHLEERYAYRNEIKRLSMGAIASSFASLEHFLDRYGYLTIDQRSDTLSLTKSGLEAARHHEKRLKSLNDDVLFHFAKELRESAESEEKPQLTTGKRFEQHYIRFEGIGRGGLGSVWRAEHLKSGRPVALKTLEGIDEVLTHGRKSTLKRRFERVIRQVARLSHPFIAPILDLSVHHTPPYYVMPLYQGGSLRDLLRSGSIEPEIALNLFNQICLGIHHAHLNGVLHLDLKPENILLDERGNVRLFDFGMSRSVAKQVAQAGRQSYVGFGSVAYMAPELLRDAQLESASVDIYSLGLILYELLVGELPGRRSPMPSDVIEGLPAPVDELFDLMTQDRVEDRPQSMSEVLAILNQVEPFDRFSASSVVMTFAESPITLPGLSTLNLPELEEADDIQRELQGQEGSSDSGMSLNTGLNTSSNTSSNTDSTSSSSSSLGSSLVGTVRAVTTSDSTSHMTSSHMTSSHMTSQAASRASATSEEASSIQERSGSVQPKAIVDLTASHDQRVDQRSLSNVQEHEVGSGSMSESGSDISSSEHQINLASQTSLESVNHLTEHTEAQAPRHLDEATSKIERSLLENDRLSDDGLADHELTSESPSERPLLSEYDDLREELEELDELDELDGGAGEVASPSEEDPIISSAPNYLAKQTARATQLTSPPRNRRSGRFEDDDKTELHVPPQQRSPQPAPMHDWPPKPSSSQVAPAQARPTATHASSSHAGRVGQVTQIKYPPEAPRAPYHQQAHPTHKGRS